MRWKTVRTYGKILATPLVIELYVFQAVLFSQCLIKLIGVLFFIGGGEGTGCTRSRGRDRAEKRLRMSLIRAGKQGNITKMDS